jgi:HAD superfamily hydrolase (TIGR01509 family)
MGHIKGVIFDMDGLLFDSERICYEAYLLAARRFGFQMNGLVHLDLVGRVEEGVVAETRRLYGDDKDVLGWRAFIKEEKEAIRESRGGRPGKRPGALELLSYLNERKVPYALASSSVRSTINSYLVGEYLSHDFEHIVDGSQVIHGKPDPEIFLRAVGLIGCDPTETLVLEDSHAGIRAANAGGFVSGFVYDDVSDMGVVTEGFPILVELPGPEAVRREAQLDFSDLSHVIGFLERER